MEMKDFITRASTLKGCINVRSRNLPFMGNFTNCDGIGDNRVEYGNMTLDEKRKEIDILVKECKALIERYQEIHDIISRNGSKKAEEKAENAARIKSIEEERSNIQGKIDMLNHRITEFLESNDKYVKEVERLRKKYEEIEKRENSGLEFIPFYGIAYVCETNKMIRDYNKDVERNNVLSAKVNNDRKVYEDNRNQIYILHQKMDKLSAEMAILWGKKGEILEVLDILGCLIQSMGDFIIAMGDAKSALRDSLLEDINKAQTAIDQTLSKIDNYHDVFCQKLTRIYGKLDSDDYSKIVKLVG